MPVNIQQAEDLWQLIKETDNVSDNRIKMLEFSEILLKHASMNEKQIEEIQEAEYLTDLMIYYLNIAEYCNHFLDTALHYIEPEHKAGDFAKDVENTNKKISISREMTQGLKSQHQALFQKKDELEAENQQLSDLKNEIFELQSIEEAIKPENIDRLKGEIERIKVDVEQRKPDLEKSEKELAELKKLEENIKTHQNAIENEKKNSLKELKKRSIDFAGTLDSKWHSMDQELEKSIHKLKLKNNQYLEILKKLDSCCEKIEEVTNVEEDNRELYKKHLHINSEIIENMKEIPDLESVIIHQSDKISEIRSNVQGQLEKFDQQLSELVEIKENIVYKIRRLNKSSLYGQF